MTPLAGGWLGVYLDSGKDKAVVSEVIPGTPAEKAGLRVGDVLISVGGTKTPTREGFVAAIGATKAGTRISIGLTRGGRERVVMVRLGERSVDGGVGELPDVRGEEKSKSAGQGRPRRGSAPAGEGQPGAVRQGKAAPSGGSYLGISIRESARGLMVDRVLADGPAAGSGIEAGDRLVSLSDHKVATLEDLDRALTKLVPGKRVAVVVTSKAATKSLLIRVGRRPGSAKAPRWVANQAVRIVEVAPGASAPAAPKEAPARRPAPANKPVAAKKPAAAKKPVAPKKPAARPKAGKSKVTSPADYDLEGEIRSLRAELQELRRLLKELRQSGGGGE